MGAVYHIDVKCKELTKEQKKKIFESLLDNGFVYNKTEDCSSSDEAINAYFNNEIESIRYLWKDIELRISPHRENKDIVVFSNAYFFTNYKDEFEEAMNKIKEVIKKIVEVESINEGVD